jgi:hypothetical protein
MSECFELIRGVAIRVTEVDECGAPFEGGLYGVSKGFTTVTVTEEVEGGDEFIVKNADGELCINERSEDNLKRYTFDIEFCRIDPALVGLISKVDLEIDLTSGSPGSPGDGVVGYRPTLGILDKKFALEVWTRLGGGVCGPNGACFGYLLVPALTGAVISGFTVENGPVTFSTSGAYSFASTGWGVGPWDVLGDAITPRPLDDPMLDDQPYLMRTTCVAPPTELCGTAAYVLA